MSSPSLRSDALDRFYLSRAPSPVAFLDESMRESPGPGEESFYQLAAVILPNDRLDDIREGLVDIAGGTFWHTTDKFRSGTYGRGDIVEMVDYVTDESEWNVFAVKMPLAGSSERDLAQARSHCLDRLVRNVTTGSGDNAVRAIVADNNKDQRLNKLDLQVVNSLRESGAVHSDVTLMHGRMGQEPLLWSADVMSWSVRRNIALDDSRFIQPTMDKEKLTVINAVDGKHLEMKHPLGASALTRGPSTQGPGLSGSPGPDVASPSMVSARDAVDNGAEFRPGQKVSHDLMSQIRALGAEARRATRASTAGDGAREQSPAMAQTAKDLNSIREAMSERSEVAEPPVEHETARDLGQQVDNGDVTPPSV